MLDLRMKEGKALPQIGGDLGIKDSDLSDCTQCRAFKKVFVVLGGTGILKGVLERCTLLLLTHESKVHKGSLLGYKFDEVLCDLEKRYPFSPAGYKKCLNYKKKRWWK